MSASIHGSILVAAVLTGALPSAQAAVLVNETLVHETTTSVELELTPETVLCSQADYSLPVLKVLIPELAHLTLLDHQNFGAGAPCVAAGACGPDGLAAEDVLDPDDLVDTVDIRVQAVRVDTVDAEQETCSTSLIERVHVDIRGLEFQHERSASLGSRPYSDCLLSQGGEAPTEEPAGPDLPADEPAPVSDESSPVAATTDRGGCSLGTRAASSTFAALPLALLFLGRRRRARATRC